MMKINDWLLNKPTNLAKSCYFWNMMGSFSLALGTMILTIIVNRIVGDFAGGDFAMALATGQLMATIGYFEVRTYQVTDTKMQFSFEDYYSARLLTTVIMIVCSIGYIIIKGYSIQKSVLVMMMCVYKMLDTLADVFEGYFQQNDRLDISGKSLSIRTIVSVLILILTLFITSNLYLSCFMSIIISVIIIYFFNIRPLRLCETYKLNIINSKNRGIIIECFPLFISSFMATFILNSSRYAVEANMPSNFHSKFTAIFLPVSTINLFIGFVLKPMLTNLAKKWNSKLYNEFMKNIYLLLLLTLIITIFAILGAYVLGIPVLSLLYGTDLSNLKIDLLILLFGGGINAANVILYYALSVMRKQKIIFIVYTIIFLLSLIIPNYLTKYYAFLGASFSFVIIMGLLGLLLFIFVFLVYLNLKNEM